MHTLLLVINTLGHLDNLDIKTLSTHLCHLLRAAQVEVVPQWLQQAQHEGLVAHSKGGRCLQQPTAQQQQLGGAGQLRQAGVPATGSSRNWLQRQAVTAAQRKVRERMPACRSPTPLADSSTTLTQTHSTDLLYAPNSRAVDLDSKHAGSLPYATLAINRARESNRSRT